MKARWHDKRYDIKPDNIHVLAQLRDRIYDTSMDYKSALTLNRTIAHFVQPDSNHKAPPPPSPATPPPPELPPHVLARLAMPSKELERRQMREQLEQLRANTKNTGTGTDDNKQHAQNRTRRDG